MGRDPMNFEIGELLKAQTEAAQSAYQSGYEIGYRTGYRDAMREAREMIAAAFAKPVEPS